MEVNKPFPFNPPNRQEEELKRIKPVLLRLEQYYKHKGIDYATASLYMHYSATNVKEVFDKPRNISVAKLAFLAENCHDLNFHWLFTGQGNMLI